MKCKAKQWVRMAAVPAIAISIGAPALAAGATQAQTGTAATPQTTAKSYSGVRATQLIDKEVRNPQNQKLGEIVDGSAVVRSARTSWWART